MGEPFRYRRGGKEEAFRYVTRKKNKARSVPASLNFHRPSAAGYANETSADKYLSQDRGTSKVAENGRIMGLKPVQAGRKGIH